MAGDALVGRELGRYLVQGVIGTGGFAVVYRAVDTVLERTVALKVVDPSSHRNPTIGRRFVLEGRAAASLDHPAIVPVYDAGDHDGVLWMAMRLVEGSSVDQALGRGRRFRPDEVVALVERIGGALDHAHGRGVVHRDVKPSNLLLEGDDPYRAHLADFGIAATARTAGRYTTGALGTAAYMAPEQSRPSEVGPPADLYSLACVAYEMLTGRRPFPGDDYVALLYAHATHAVPPVGDPAVDAVMSRAMAKAPADRPASGRALAHELRQALASSLQGSSSSSAVPGSSGAVGSGTSKAAVPAHAAGEPAAAAAVAATAAPARTEHYEPAAATQVEGSTRAGDAAQVDHHGGALAPTRAEDRPATLDQGHRPAGPHGGGPDPSGALGPPVEPRDPTVVRRGRMARRRVAAGALALLVAAGTLTAVLLDRRSSPGRRVDDSAGISYELASGWDVGTVEPPTTTLVDDGDTEVVTITHAPADSADAVTALVAAGASLCESDPVAYDGIDGSGASARCDNPGGTEPATVVGAIAGNELWVITVASAVTTDERDDFLASIRLQSS